MRDALDLVSNGLLSSREFIAPTMVASKHHDRSVVLNHCSELPIAVFISQLENSDYFALRMFGALLLPHMLFSGKKALKRFGVWLAVEDLSSPGPCWGVTDCRSHFRSFFSLEGSGCCLR